MQLLHSLQSKDFLTGIASSAHAVRGGLFYKAAGVTAINSPGGTEAAENGLLRGGPPATDIGGVTLADTPIASAKHITSGGTPTLYIMGASGHLYTYASLASSITDLRTGSPAALANSANGLAVYRPKNGAAYLYYSGKTFIGRYGDLDGSPSFSDSWQTGLTSTTQHPLHVFQDSLYFGNYNKVGKIYDNGVSDATIDLNVLDIPANHLITAIADDGVYLAIATTDNVSSTAVFGTTKILFWDGYSSSWLRDYTITDQFIVSLTRVGNTLLAQGQRGIYQISFAGGVKKLLSRSTGLGTTGSTRQIGPHLAAPYLQEGYVFAWQQFVGTMGKMDDQVPQAFMMPIKLTTNSSIDASMVQTQYDVGRIIVGTNEPKLQVYSFSNLTSAQTSVTAQTVYLSLPTRFSISRIEVVFGEPLVSGDAMDIDLYTDQDTSTIDFGSASFTSDGAIRRKSMLPLRKIICEQYSLAINFTAGAPKIKQIDVFGDKMTP